MGSPDIRQLTQSIVAGDETAFGRFYDLYSGRLWRFLLVLTCGQEDRARELHQVVMIKVARKFRVFTTSEALWAWLAQVARHACIDHFRKHNRRAEQPLSESSFDTWQTAGAEVEQRLTERLEHALQCLDADERALIEAAYFEDRAHSELALEKAQTTKAVESRLARIRGKLRKFILIQLRHERRETP